MASTIRSFIAVDLTADHKRSLGRLARQLAERWPEYRWCDEDQFHVTLNFLGDVPDEQIPRVCQIMRESLTAHNRFSFDLAGLGAFPKNARPRVVWAGVDQGKSQLSRIYHDLRENLEELRLERDRKAFRPHVTLGRIRNNQRWPDSMIEHLDDRPSLDLGPVDVDEVILYSSFLEKTGPTYTVMDRIPLA